MTVTPALAWAIAVLLAGAGIGMTAAVAYAVVGGARGGTSPRTVLQRGASYAGLALVLAAAAASGVPGIAVLAAAIGAVGLLEWSDLFALPLHHRLGLLIANLAIVGVVAVQGSAGAPLLVGGLVLVGAVWPVIRADTGRAVRDLGIAAVGCALIPVLLAHGVALRVEWAEDGGALLVALAVACACSDVGAFLVGRRLGRRPLAPLLSPHKTQEGLIGNLVGAAIGIALFAPALAGSFGVVLTLLFVPLVAAGSIWGDLLESAAKREAGAKDAGHWLPGFGGILDRVDSLLITAPLAYWAVRLVQA